MATARATRDEREHLLPAYERSGLAQEAFAEKKGLSVSTLRSWIYRRRDAASGAAAEPRLLPVRVVASPAHEARAAGEHFEVALASGVVPRFATGTDAGYVAKLIAALG